jgi:hypothetical protein
VDELNLDGHAITFDLSQVSHREYVAFWGQTMSEEEKSAFLLKVCGISGEQVEDLPEPDWRRFRDWFRDKCFESLETQEKNSPSAST